MNCHLSAHTQIIHSFDYQFTSVNDLLVSLRKKSHPLIVKEDTGYVTGAVPLSSQHNTGAHTGAIPTSCNNTTPHHPHLLVPSTHHPSTCHTPCNTTHNTGVHTGATPTSRNNDTGASLTTPHLPVPPITTPTPQHQSQPDRNTSHAILYCV
ncbi:hypothetical protein DEO72_LG2g1365 [Vigna unguiculata]|uniref:Uncharacterized protein n=1 Tax=Vigna unguiculata TaxID=3917 RepID=A0A4D6L067_VIGUN|nr:hypothetical protein DEO72_LG2g1365 [Vigna unguiculata]